MGDTEAKYQMFHALAKIKLKAGETLQASYSFSNELQPRFVITSQFGGTYALYTVTNWKLKLLKTSASLTELDGIASNEIKSSKK